MRPTLWNFGTQRWAAVRILRRLFLKRRQIPFATCATMLCARVRAALCAPRDRGAFMDCDLGGEATTLWTAVSPSGTRIQDVQCPRALPVHRLLCEYCVGCSLKDGKSHSQLVQPCFAQGSVQPFAHQGIAGHSWTAIWGARRRPCGQLCRRAGPGSRTCNARSTAGSWAAAFIVKRCACNGIQGLEAALRAALCLGPPDVAQAPQKARTLPTLNTAH